MFEQPVAIFLNETDTNHYLRLLASDVWREYFPDCSELPIRWGQQIVRKRRRSIRLGSYDHRNSEVRIHPSLDSPMVPRFFIQSIIYHEYLHHRLGPRHNRRFQAQDRRYRFHRESKLWLKANLPVLLGRRSRPSSDIGVMRSVQATGPLQQLSLF